MPVGTAGAILSLVPIVVVESVAVALSDEPLWARWVVNRLLISGLVGVLSGDMLKKQRRIIYLLYAIFCTGNKNVDFYTQVPKRVRFVSLGAETAQRCSGARQAKIPASEARSGCVLRRCLVYWCVRIPDERGL